MDASIIQDPSSCAVDCGIVRTQTKEVVRDAKCYSDGKVEEGSEGTGDLQRE